MHCRVVEGSITPDKFEAGLESLRAAVLPKLKDLPGIAGAYWLADRKSGQTVAVTFYDTEADMISARPQSEALRNSGFEAAGIQFGRVKEFEVIGRTGDKVSTTAASARLTMSQGDPASIDDAARMIKEMVIPAATQMAGFAGGVWLGDRSDGMGIALTLWASADAMNKSQSPAGDLRQRAMTQGNLQLISVNEYEVVARSETPARAGAGS